MAHGEFIWCDLSAYDPPRAMRFYSDVFDWRWSDGGDGMHIATRGGTPVGALYQMPEKFMTMGMPSFWMGYIAVDDAAAVVEHARQLGGIVELGPESFPGGGTYALIRDPLGAGFTVLQGEPGQAVENAPGSRAGHALFVSDVSAVQPFYEALFEWNFEKVQDGVCPVVLNGAPIFHCHEIPDPAVRGKEQFWAVMFGQAGDLSRITKAGGTVEAEMGLPEGDAVLARDPSGAAFVILKGNRPEVKGRADLDWGWIGLGLVLASVFTTQLWPWAIFLGVWVVQALRHGETHLLSRVEKREQPVLFWAIMAVFSALAVISVLYPFGAEFG